MLDISVSYNRYAFLGYEFLTWLWFMIDQKPAALAASSEKPVSFEVGNRIVIENRSGSDALETLTIKGDDAGLEEAMVALRKGALVAEMNLFYREADHEWQFTVKAESLHLTSVKTPKTERVTDGDAMEAALLEKTYLYECVVTAVRTLYRQFVHQRLSEDWRTSVIPDLRRWISAEKNT